MTPLCPLVIIASLVLWVTHASGQDIWSNSSGGLFHVGANWTDGTIPLAGESASFNLPDAYAVEWDTTTGDTLGSELSVNGGTLTFFSTGGTRSHTLASTSITPFLRINSGSLRLGRSAGEEFNLDAGELAFISDAGNLQVNFGSQLTLGDSIYVGHTNDGSLQISSGGRVFSASGNLGRSDSNGNATIAGGGSFWEMTDLLKVGSFRGDANMEVLGGGVLRAGTIDVGGFESTTLLSVSGTGSQIDVNGVGLILRDGDARVNVLSGGSLTTTHAFIGTGGAGSNAIATVSNVDSDWTNDGVLTIGSGGNASLRINDGGSVSSGEVWIGNRGNGEVLLSDAGSLVSTGIVRVGHNSLESGGTIGDGTLVVSAGGQLTSNGGIIGSAFQADGEATITGAGSRWISNGRVSVGQIGTGSLLVEEGGFLSSTSGSVNNSAGKTDIATIRGSDSQWLLAGELRVGGSGTGQLNIGNGGNVTSESGRVVGSGGASSATVAITGSGSMWNVGALVVGGEGEARVSVSGEGAGLTASFMSIGSAGSSTTEGSFSVADKAIVVVDGITSISGTSSRIQVTGFGTSFGSDEIRVGGGFLEVQDFGQVSATSLVNLGSFGTILGSGRIVSNLIESRGQIQSSGLTLQSDVMLLAGSTLSTETGASTSVLGNFSHNGDAVFTDAGASLFINGIASGNGDYTGTGDLIFTGELSPGSSAAVINFDGNVMLDSLALTSIELGGIGAGEFDQLLIAGDFLINGNLSVSLIDGFALAGGMEFQFADVEGDQFGFFNRPSDGAFLDEGDLVGNFGGHDLFITYNGFDGNAGVGLFTAVPEPGSTGVIVVCALALLGRRRR